jgi:hypothetical protein
MQRNNEEATMSLGDERPDHRKRPSNSQHVELVLARIFSRRGEYAKQRSFRSFNVADFETDRS